MPEFGAALSRVLMEYPAERASPLANHPLASFIRSDLPTLVRERLPDPRGYKVQGSAGKGNWAETTWVAVFDLLVTDTATRGFYIVYLFRPDGGGVYLSLNQGTTEVRNMYGPRYREVLAHQGRAFRALLTDQDSDHLSAGPIALEGSSWLTRGYESGNIAAQYYAAEDMPTEDVLRKDLLEFLNLYAHLVEQHDRLMGEVELEEEKKVRTEEGGPEKTVAPALEARREGWHRRVERNSKLARDAKRVHGDTCQVCGFTFRTFYGDVGNGYIEAHHIVPFAELKGRPTQLDPRTDFAVLCANCHRVVHRSRPPMSLDALRNQIDEVRDRS